MKRNRIRGFTLIEVLFAIFLAMTCAVIVAGVMPLANTSRAKADLRNRATSLGQKMAEAVVHLGYSNANPAQLTALGLLDNATPVSANTYTFTNIDTAIVDSPASALPSGTGRVTITEPSPDLRQVVVVVGWRSEDKNQEVRIVHQVANL
jgi:Tfp pilus assembly protein PilV